MKKQQVQLAIVVALILLVMGFGSRFYISVPAGHAAAATLFGKVREDVFREGLHFPVNPLYSWHIYDVRQKTHAETANVPTQDQLQTRVDVSVQYRLIGKMIPRVLQNTGSYDDMVRVHLVPKLRSMLREQGKSITRAEDFFQDKTQENLQIEILSGLRAYLEPQGVEVMAVLIRDITLPPFITKAIESKKEREQEVEKQKAELERYTTEMKQMVVSAEAERKAAEENAQKIRLLADAQAYEIEKINRAIANNPGYIKLQALEALKAISKDNSSKIYFINGDSPNPLPLMHIGDTKR
jgi:regulator of protease activity HflC (stomatin/prohibitin superfamily)